MYEIENPEKKRIVDIIDSEGYDPSEKTLMQLENDYKWYKTHIKWEDHVLKIASEKGGDTH